MPQRSQSHKRAIQSYDSGGNTNAPPITGIGPDTATIAAVGAVSRTVATLSVTGGTAPIVYTIANAAGMSIAITGGNLLTTTVNPCGTVGAKAVQITATDARGQTKTETITVTVT